LEWAKAEAQEYVDSFWPDRNAVGESYAHC
jgi:hypothetical protein